MMKNKQILVTMSILLMMVLPVSVAQGQTIIFSDGFESGDILQWNGQTTFTNDTLNVITTDPYHGTYHGEADISGDGSGKALVYKTVNMATIYAGGMFKFKTALPGLNQGVSIIDLMSGSTMVARVAFRDTGGALRIYLNYMSGDVFTQSFMDYSWGLDTWYNVELYAKIDGSAGEYALYVNGIEELAVTGLDSDNYGSVTEVRAGVTYSGLAAHEVYFDAFTISDSYIGSKLFTLTTGVDGQGIIETSPNGPYEPDSDVSVTATPSSGWMFSGWTSHLTGTNNPDTVTMNRNKTVIAIFTSQGDVTVATSESSYDRLDNLVVQVRAGTESGAVMLQVNRGATLVWMDQRDLDASGNLDYTLKIPNTWSDGTYTIYIKDVDSDTSYQANFEIPVSDGDDDGNGGGGGGGGGGGFVYVMLPTTLQITRFSPEEAAEILDNFDADDVARKLTTIENKTHVANIMSYFDPSYGIAVLREFSTDFASQLLNMMSNESALALIMEMTADDGEILEAMVNDDFNNSVILVETAIKNADGLSEEERAEALQRLGEAISSIDTATLVELLISIAQLPETPRTVALFFESTSLSSVLDVVSVWIGEEQYSYSLVDLANVFEHLSTDTLGNVYRGITNPERITILAYLSEQVILRLPEIGVFVISDLTVSPAEIEPGQTFEISYKLQNVGNETDDYVVPVKINGETVFTDQGVLPAGETMTMTHTMSEDLGTYTLDVLGETLEFDVEEPYIEPVEPANIVVISMEVSPESVEKGQEITVSVVVMNIGDLTGTEDIELYVDSAMIDSKEVVLTPDDETTLLFNVMTDYSDGSHVFKVGEKTASFEIYSKATTPWFTIITAALILISAGAYYVISKRKKFSFD